MRMHFGGQWCRLLVLTLGCGGEPSSTAQQDPDAQTQAGLEVQQGSELQGSQLQGSELQGSELQGSQLQGLSLEGISLHGLAGYTARVEKGELVLSRVDVAGETTTVRGAELVGATFTGEAVDRSTQPPTVRERSFRIAAVEPEAAAFDPTQTGATFLYELEQRDVSTGAWGPACKADAAGVRRAIPIAAIFDTQGNRQESTTQFTFACTAGVLAKCYRWGYRPWLASSGGPAVMRDAHLACTRMARADYCGDGTPHTRDGTRINIWDTLASPGPIQSRGIPAVGMVFEAGWTPRGAACLSHARWLSLPPSVWLACPQRLIPPGLGLLGGTVCNSVSAVLSSYPEAKLFNDSELNIAL